MKDRAPTYAEVLQAARVAAEQFERWPAWKKALSEPERVSMRPEVAAKPSDDSDSKLR